MATLYSPKIVTDGLVLALDAANTNSFRGEPTTNIAYNSNGTIDWGITNLTASVSRTTVVTDSIYRITSTTGGTFRILFNLSKLVNGTTYTLSYNYKIISGGPTFTMNDWNDTNIFNVINTNIGDYTFSAASGTRATYDSTYRFMDFNISASTVVEIWNLQLEAKTYPTPFIAGIRGTTVATGGGWADRSGNLNHGQLVNGPTFSSGNLGSISFDGVDDRVITSTVAVYENNMTWEGWANRESSVNLYNMFMGQFLPYFAFRSNNEFHFSNRISGTQRNLYSTGITVQNNTWYHLTFTTEYDGTNTLMKIYINGVFNNSASFLGSQSNEGANLTIGDGRNTSTWYPFDGKVSNVKVYNRTLTAAEVLQNYNATKGRFGL